MWIEEVKNDNDEIKAYKFVERYLYPYTNKYRRVSTQLKSNSTHARKKAKKILDDKIEVILNQAEVTDATFYSVLNEWLPGYKKTLRPASIMATDSRIKIIKKHIKEDVLISKMDARYVQQFMDKLDYSNDYLSHVKSLFNLLFNYAVDKKYIKESPMPNVKVNYKAKTIEDFVRIGDKFLEVDEAEALIKELYRTKRTYRIGRTAEFLYLTGARIGEVVILKEEDFIGDEVRISGTIDYTQGYKRGKKGPTKTLKGFRDVKLTQRTLDLVQRTIEENKLDAINLEKFDDRNFVFVTKSGTPTQTNSFNLALKAAGERVGINKNLSSHIFRHTHVSILAENNVPLKAIMDRVGHEDEKITRDIYMHVTKKMKDNVLDVLNTSGL